MSDTLKLPLFADRSASTLSTVHLLDEDEADEEAPTERAPFSSAAPTLRCPVLTVTTRSPRFYPIKVAARRLHMHPEILEQLILHAAKFGGDANVANLGAIVAYRIGEEWRVRLPER